MKKSLVLALGLAAPAFAGEPVIAPAPIVTPAPACCPLSVEVAGGYAFATGDIMDGIPSKEIDLYTADITGVYNINEKHAGTHRVGYGIGEDTIRLYDATVETDVRTVNIMPGYRYTHAVNEKWSVFAGANVGIARLKVEECFDGPGYDRAHAEDSAWGLAWSLEVGASYKMSSNWSVFATYGIFGNSAEPELSNPEVTIPVDNQNYHGFRIGVDYKF